MATTIFRKAPEWEKMQESRNISYVLMEDAWVLHPGCVRFHAQCILPWVRDALHAFVHLLHLAFNHLQQSILICRRPLQYALRQLCLHIQGDVRLEDPCTTHQDSAFHHCGQIIPAEIVETLFMSDISTSVTLARTLPLAPPNFDCCLLLFSNQVFDLEVVGLIFPFHSHNGIIHHRSRQLLSQRTGQPPHSLKSPTIFVPKWSPCCYMGENWFILADFCCKKWIAIKSDITRTDCISSNMGLNFCYTRAIWTFVQRQNLKLPISESFHRKAGGSYNQPIFESLSASRLWGPLTHSLSGPLWDFHLEINKDQLLERKRENGARCKKRRIVTANLFRKWKQSLATVLTTFSFK